MVCMDTLFYRKDDQAVARVQTMQQLYDAIGPDIERDLKK